MGCVTSLISAPQEAARFGTLSYHDMMVRQRTRDFKGSDAVEERADNVATVTSAQTADDEDSRAVAPAAGNPHRQRLLDALAASITEDGYRNTTVAGCGGAAQASRRPLLQHLREK